MKSKEKKNYFFGRITTLTICKSELHNLYVINSFQTGQFLFHLVPLRVLKCHLNGATQTSCDDAHQDSAKRKRKQENQIYIYM